MVVEIKALACELPHEYGIPLSRFSISEIRREVERRGLVASIGDTTIWRWLNNDAIRPWYHRSWIFPRDPCFKEKAGRILDLYQGIWRGKPLRAEDCVISTDEKTSIQARRRIHPILPPDAGRDMRVEFEYERQGALAYLAAWDVQRARIFGRCERKTGIKPFGKLVHQVMSQKPYRSASRVFWVMDNGSSHRGQRCEDSLKKQWPQIRVVHTPVHASWLNQIEIYFSIIQRKVLVPNNFRSLAELEERLLRFQDHYEEVAKPFQWKFKRSDLVKLLEKINDNENLTHKAA